MCLRPLRTRGQNLLELFGGCIDLALSCQRYRQILARFDKVRRHFERLAELSLRSVEIPLFEIVDAALVVTTRPWRLTKQPGHRK